MNKQVTAKFPICVEIKGKTARESLNLIRTFKIQNYKVNDKVTYGQILYKGANAVYCIVGEKLPTIVLQFYFREPDKKQAVDFKLTFT